MNLNVPMTQHDFEQVTLLANMIAICKVIINREKPGSKRRHAYAEIHKLCKRVEDSIPGHLNGRSIDQSEQFYMDIEKAVGKFLRSFHEWQPQGRDSQGRFLPQEVI